MILPTFIAAVKGWKLVFLLLGAFLFAVGEGASSHTLIVISLIGSFTTLLVAIMGFVVSIINGRRTQGGIHKIDKLVIEVDGKLKELTEAREGVAHAAGMQQERIEERGRTGSLTQKIEN